MDLFFFFLIFFFYLGLIDGRSDIPMNSAAESRVNACGKLWLGSVSIAHLLFFRVLIIFLGENLGFEPSSQLFTPPCDHH